MLEDFVCFTGSEISQELTFAFFALLQHPIAMKLSQFRRVETRPDMQPINILRDKIFQQIDPLHGNQRHMRERRDRRFHIDDIGIRLIFDSLSFLLPGPRASFQDRIHTRSEIRDPTGSRDPSSRECNEMLAIQDKIGHKLYFLFQHFFGVEIFDFVLFFLVGCVCHLLFFLYLLISFLRFYGCFNK